MPRFRPPAPGRRLNSAARSSRCRRKRGIRATSANTAGAQRTVSDLVSGRQARSPIFRTLSGEYQLFVQNQDGKGEIRKYKLTGTGFYEAPAWSPDSQKISYVDNSQTLYWIDLKYRCVQKDRHPNYLMGSEPVQHSWSPDSKWIAYTRNNQVYIQSGLCLFARAGQVHCRHRRLERGQRAGF